jgi:hypothetical protein
VAMTSATISQASAAGMEPLNESIAITIFIGSFAVLQFRIS